MKSIREIAEKYDVTPAGVRYWLEDGKIKKQWKREKGKKPFIVVDEKEVEEYLKSKGTVWG